MEITDRQQVGLACGEPLACRCPLALGAMAVPAAVVGDAPLAAVLAAFDVAAERSGAASLDRRHHLELGQADMAGMCRAPRWPMNSKDVGDLVTVAAGLAARVLAFHQQPEMLERARYCTDRLGGDTGVERGRIQLGVPEQNLDYADIDILE
jgi:hypothetical protein